MSVARDAVVLALETELTGSPGRAHRLEELAHRLGHALGRLHVRVERHRGLGVCAPASLVPEHRAERAEIAMALDRVRAGQALTSQSFVERLRRASKIGVEIGPASRVDRRGGLRRMQGRSARATA